MATNKHAIIRYRVIDQCLRRVDQAWNWKSLSEACSEIIEKTTGQSIKLSKRTIKGDIMAMRNDYRLGYFAPIEYDRKEKSYYYSDRKFSITESPLSKSDSLELKQVIGLLRQFTGFKYLEGIDNIVHKLELIAYESTGKSKQIVHLEQAVTIPGQEWLDKLYTAVKEEQPISIQYRAFEKKPYITVISPYVLKEYKNRWYLVGLNHEKKQIRTYGLERIKSIKNSLSIYIPSAFDPEQYYNDIIGITLVPNQRKKKIVFEAYGYLIPFLQTQPIHNSQKLIEFDKQKYVYSLDLIPNNELENLFLSYGNTVQIIEPKRFRNKIMRRTQLAAALYD